MKRTIKHILLWKIIIIVGYFAIGVIFHHYLFPPHKPDLTDYFHSGDKFHSSAEGFDQHILWQKDGWVRLSLVIEPKGFGPPEHIHTNLDETFTVKEGVLSILVNGEKKTLQPGNSITVKSGTPHKPFNETDLPVIVESTEDEQSLPVEFAYYLSQLYPFVDSLGENPSALAMIMQLSIYGDEMDAYLANAGPIRVQKAMRFLLAPTARLFGYKGYYEEYRVVHNSE